VVYVHSPWFRTSIYPTQLCTGGCQAVSDSILLIVGYLKMLSKSVSKFVNDAELTIYNPSSKSWS